MAESTEDENTDNTANLEEEVKMVDEVKTPDSEEEKVEVPMTRNTVLDTILPDHPPLVPYDQITKDILNSYCLYDDA